MLVCNSNIESDLGHKTKPQYLGPMVIVRRTRNGAYCLAELDGALSKLRYAAFRLVPYHACSHASIPVTRVLDHKDLITMVEEEVANMADNSDDEEGLTRDGQDFNPLGGVRRPCALGSEQNVGALSTSMPLNMIMPNPHPDMPLV